MRFGYLLFDNRSGSTYFSAILNQYKFVSVSRESYFTTRILDYTGLIKSKEDLPELVAYLYEEVQFQELSIPKSDLTRKLQGLAGISRKAVIVEVIKLVFKNENPDGFWLIKDPVYRYLDVLKEMFPEVKYVHIFRDGRGVHKSKKRAVSLDGTKMTNSVVKSCVKWAQRFREIESAEIGQECLTHVRYEDLLTSGDEICEKVIANLGGSDFTKSNQVEDYHNAIGSKQASLHDNIAGGAMVKNISDWQESLTKSEIRLYQKLNGRTLKKYGYNLLDVKMSLIEWTRYQLFVTDQLVRYFLGIVYRVYYAVFVNRNVSERFRVFFSLAKRS